MVKSNGLLGILTMSEYRKNILFLLMDRPWSLSEIKDHFDVESPEIIPRLNEMVKSRVITKQNGLYSITPFGKALAKKYKPLLDTIQAIETNSAFWNEHDISPIPDELLDRIGELKGCKVVQLDESIIGASHKAFLENAEKAEVVRGATSTFNPLWTKLFLELSKSGAAIEIVTTESVLKIIKNDYASELEDLLQNPKAHIYVNNELKIAFATMISHNSRFLSLGLHFTNGKYDPNSDLEGTSQYAVSWGDALFKYYKEQAVEVPRIEPVNDLVFTKGENEEMELEFN